MPIPVIKQFVGFEDSMVSFMARVTKDNANLITQAVTSSVTLTIRDIEIPETDVAASPYTLVVNDVIFDTLQTDGAWTEDSTGYNFRHDAVKAQLPDGNKRYRFEFKFVPTSGEDFYAVYEGNILQLYGS